MVDFKVTIRKKKDTKFGERWMYDKSSDYTSYEAMMVAFITKVRELTTNSGWEAGEPVSVTASDSERNIYATFQIR